MPPEPIRQSALALDLSPRFQASTTVVASPAAAAETIVGQLSAINQNLTVVSGVVVVASVSYTVGTSGTAVTLRIRQTNVAGQLIASSGAQTRVAANLSSDVLQGFDPAPVIPGQVYVVTMQVTAGAASSAVSAVSMVALVF